MFTLRVALLVATLTLTVAHPHPHLSYHPGECMEMRTSARSGRIRWNSPPFRCMKDIKLPREERRAKHDCTRKGHDYMLSFFKGDKIDDVKYKNLEEVKTKRQEFVAGCMVDRLGLEASDGFLDTAKVLENSLKMDSSDVSALMKMQTIINICVTNSTGVNATEQFLLLRSCIRQLVQEQCNLHQQLLRAYLERGRDASPVCANVSTEYQNSVLEDLFDTCMAEHAVKSSVGAKGQSVSHNSLFAQNMISCKIDVAKKMEWFSTEAGFNGELYRDFVSNFTWEFAPEGRDEILKAMEECDMELEGSAYNQVYQWESCFAPKIVEVCGFNNNVTKFFFPFINADIQKAALEYIEDLTDDDSAEDMDDYQDDYDYEYDDDYDEEVDDDDYDDYQDKTEEYLDDDKSHSDENDFFDEAETVDDGLLDMGPTMLEIEKDAMLVGSAADGLKTKDSVEDDAEEFMARVKSKEENTSDGMRDSEETTSETYSEGTTPDTDTVSEEVSTEEASTEEVFTEEVSTEEVFTERGSSEILKENYEEVDRNDFEGELSVGEAVFP